jgi:hypothetical protein
MNTSTLPGAADKASEIFRQMVALQWVDVRADFDQTMREAVSAETLAEGWAQTAATVGAFEKQGEPFVRAADTLTVVDVPLAFEAGDMVGRVAFSADALIAGLFVLTPSAAAGL